MESRLHNIREGLATLSDWHLKDYQDFYKRDVTFLLAEVDRLRKQIVAERVSWIEDSLRERAQ